MSRSANNGVGMTGMDRDAPFNAAAYELAYAHISDMEKASPSPWTPADKLAEVARLYNRLLAGNCVGRTE